MTDTALLLLEIFNDLQDIQKKLRSLMDAMEPPTAAEQAAERERQKRLPTTDIPIRIAKLFNRRLTTEWSKPEIKALKSLTMDPDDLSLVERYYRDSGSKFLRRDIGTFLNNFNGEVDRARAWEAAGAKREGTGQRNGEYQEQIDIEKFTFRA